MPINGTPVHWNYDGNFSCTFTPPTDNYSRIFNGILTAPRTYTYPDKSGTFALLSDVIGVNGGNQLIGTIKGANMNTTNDQIVSLTGGSIYIVTDIILKNPSANLTGAVDGEWWSGVSRTGTKTAHTGTAIREPFSKMIASNSYANSQTAGQIIVGDSNTTISSLYFSLGTPLGVAATVDIEIYGYVVS